MEQDYLEFAFEIAIYAKLVMNKYFKEDNGAEYKYDDTIVTKADKEINNYLIKKVKEKYPNHCVIGEENSSGKSNYAWVCDPVDGTAMYARHIPVAVFSLALEVDGKPIVGVVYDPFTDNLYSAIKGKGAFRNGKMIHVSDISLDDKKSVANYDMWPTAEYNLIDVLKKLGRKSYFVAIGSVIRASMCVATGDFTCAIFPGTKNKFCDMAAASLIVTEAGGKVTDLEGNDQRYDKTINGAIISNKVNYQELLSVIKDKVIFKSNK